MSLFFNGRQWISPAVMSLVDDSAMRNKNLTVGNILAVIGKSEGGEPFSGLRFGSPQEARAVLRSGELLTAIEKAFDPSPQTFGPSLVVGIRVNPAVQSGLTLVDGSDNDVIELTSTDYGLYTNDIKVKVEAGSIKGKKLTSQFGNDYYSKDNVYRDAFSVVYSGAEATAIMSITETSVVLEAPADTVVATIDLTVYKTIGQVVDRINALDGFSAYVLDGNIEKPALRGLDGATDQSVKTTPYTVTANLQACVDWLNSAGEGFLDAVRADGALEAPTNVGFTYLSGGTDGSVTTQEWQDAFDVLQALDVQWVTPVSPLDAIHAMADTHCAYMTNIARMERRAICGTDVSTSDASAITKAKALNSDRSSLMHLGFYDYDDDGELVLLPPYIHAALVAGAFSGVDPGTPLTNKAIKVRGLERKLRNPTDTDALIEGGVLCVEDTPKGFKIVKSITTWLVNDNYNRVEVSTGVATDFVARNVRDALDDLRGSRASPLILGEAISRTESALRELARPQPVGPGVIVGDKENPPYKNIVASIEGDVLRVEFQCSPVIPVNYIPVVIHAVPWSGTARL